MLHYTRGHIHKKKNLRLISNKSVWLQLQMRRTNSIHLTIVTVPTPTFCLGGSRFWHKGSWAGRLPWEAGLWRPGWWRLTDAPLCHTTVWPVGIEQRPLTEKLNMQSSINRNTLICLELFYNNLHFNLKCLPHIMISNEFILSSKDVK